MWSVLGAVCYFGWPIIEAILIVLPLPDPRFVKEYFYTAKTFLFSLPAAFNSKQEPGPIGAAAGYREGFEQMPGGLHDEDDDEEDVGRLGLSSDKLNYDSDEKEDGEGNELISIDSSAQKKKVPKLRGPKK